MADKKYLDKIRTEEGDYYLKASAIDKEGLQIDNLEQLTLVKKNQQGIVEGTVQIGTDGITFSNESPIIGLKTPNDADVGNMAATKSYVDNQIDSVESMIDSKIDSAVLSKRETWTFTLKSGETITKEIAVWTSQT